MHLARRFAVVCLLVGLGCGDSGAPVTPSTITLLDGNNQSGMPGDSLALRLRVTVMGSDMRPLAGAQVTWTVDSGSAAVTSPTTADASGVASSKLTVGVTPGGIKINATVTGLAPVLFRATALDPCTVRVAHTLGSSTTAALTSFDCRIFINTTGGPVGPFFTDFYTFSLPAQQSFIATMSGSFDTYLEQYHATGSFTGYSDDTDSTNTNSRFVIIAALGNYILAPSSFDPAATGAYTLTTAVQAVALTGCRGIAFLPWITRGVAMAEQVQSTDCTVGRAAGGRAFVDRVLITLSPEQPLTVTMASGIFNPRVELFRIPNPLTATFVTAVDGTGGSAVLSFTAADTAIYRLDLTSVDTVQSGAYTLNVAGTSPGEAARTELIGPWGWRVKPGRGSPR
jgi:hypothetical protein